MKNYLLLFIMFSGLLVNSQNKPAELLCNAYFKYEVNNKMMWAIPSTGIDFYDKSDVAATAWWWDFGDGITSTEQNPFHVYVHPTGGPNVKISPYRTVTLTILTADSCKSQYSQMINILDGNSYSDPPDCRAIFKAWQSAYDPNSGKVTFQFDNYSEGDSLSFYWKFDNGQTSNERNPSVAFDIKPDKHDVSLTVTGKNNCSDTSFETVYFFDPNQNGEDPIECYINFGYNINYTVNTFAPSLTLDFYAKDVPFVTDWLWDFGDGSTSTEKNPTHTFNLPLSGDSVLGDPNPFRTVCLTVKTSADCEVQECQTIDLYMNSYPVDTTYECIARYKYRMLAIDSIAKKVTIEFNNYSEGKDPKYIWTFNNGQISNDLEPKMTFGFDELPFKASLTIYGNDNCTHTMWDEVTFERFGIYPPVDPYPTCLARFKSYRPDIISIPEVIPYQFVDGSIGNVVSWLWQFEDGSYSSEASPLVNFDFMKPTQHVCLTVYTSDNQKDTYCETIYLQEIVVDSGYIENPGWQYAMRVTGNFPIEMSSCAGTARAQVFLKDSLVEAKYYTWSNGVEGQEVSGLCPTQTYSVKAITPEGISVSSTFIFNADGTVSEIPSYWDNWYLTGGLNNQLIKFNRQVQDIFVEWHLCDGSVVVSDSIPLELINCGGDKANMVMKDAAGNTISAETISLKTLATKVNPVSQTTLVSLFPNPVVDVLNIKYSGKLLPEMQIDILDISGKKVSSQQIFEVESGQNISLNVSSLRNGLFICKMSSGTQMIGMEKFLK